MTNEELERKVLYLLDYIAIEKLQSTYSHYHHCCMWNEIPSLFAVKTEEVEIDLNGKCVVGSDAPQIVFVEGSGSKTEEQNRGWLGLHMAVNPVIEIDKDGRRARAIWHSPGLLTPLLEGQRVPEWYYGKYVMEYVKEDDEWKILKLNYRLLFNTPYEGKGWVEQPTTPTGRPKPLPVNKPTTYYQPYDPSRFTKFEPPPPEPYED